ncbi:hypothetical protein PGT21_033963 [Puccinia graminis f. sp. tritici]|uniref:Uncharacterized protein n=1 Tax=Puccinia graminis f. sp. tritici TaxID=56615 RepID=A0A5B0QCB1_PUCGR|nr:hypothetical protein PGT21_033963 [Puccinia graminis f. sp. tritici]
MSTYINQLRHSNPTISSQLSTHEANIRFTRSGGSISRKEWELLACECDSGMGTTRQLIYRASKIRSA